MVEQWHVGFLKDWHVFILQGMKKRGTLVGECRAVSGGLGLFQVFLFAWDDGQVDLRGFHLADVLVDGLTGRAVQTVEHVSRNLGVFESVLQVLQGDSFHHVKLMRVDVFLQFLGRHLAETSHMQGWGVLQRVASPVLGTFVETALACRVDIRAFQKAPTFVSCVVLWSFHTI